MASKFELDIATRKRTGKGGARSTRREGNIPGIIYGKGTDPVAVKTPLRPFLKTVGGHSVSNMILDLALDEGEPVKALIREIQMDPLTNEVLHVDFNRVSTTQRIEIDIPVELEGVPIGVKNFGGILAHPMRTVTVLCLAVDVPEKITVDVSELGLGEAIHVSDLVVEGIEVVTDQDLTVAAVNQPMAEEVVEVEEGVESEEGATAEDAKEGDAKEDDAKDGDDKKDGKEKK